MELANKRNLRKENKKHDNKKYNHKEGVFKISVIFNK